MGWLHLVHLLKGHPKNKTGNLSRYNLVRSKNIKFDVVEGQLASNKILDIKKMAEKQRKYLIKNYFHWTRRRSK